VASCTIGSIMTQEVVTILPGAPVVDVVNLMRAQRLSCIVVCDDDVPVGIISERDIVGIAASPLSTRGAAMAVRDFMTSPVNTIRETDTLELAIARTQEAKVRRLPVVGEKGSLIGLVTQTDIVRAYRSYMEALVAQRTAQLAEMNEKLQELARQDGLLGIGNRRAMEESLGQLHQVALRYARPYSVVLVDVDDFKLYNDRYGHLAGDDALKRVVREIEQSMRDVDQVYRYGGEELLLALPETPTQGGLTMANRICAAVHDVGMPHQDSAHGVLTISCGVAGLPSALNIDSWRALVELADQALYRCKNKGRNCVEVHD